MEIFEDLIFDSITENDVDALTEIMTRAFDDDTKQFLGEEKGGPRGYDTGVFIRRLALESSCPAFKLSVGPRLAGAVIVRFLEDGTGILEILFIDPSFNNQGIGFKIWSFIEAKYPSVTKWMTETPGYSKRNHYFYIQKCGFKLVEKRNSHHPREESYILEKLKKS
ncbi:GNAT family N-acetyltransferase [Paenibacillus caui]|uniref:GNAT family N-acetyltransferase n=1 Tax=Paenibacillus caui TaxID=2873927 RepID=UPI001CA9AB35|nr:GNAT family N-acetyltransferase [Paenibacillus caui]